MEDRRIRRTKQRVEDALIDLLLNKHISTVSVTELCQKADINRNTFYAHYQTPLDVLREIEERYYQMKIRQYDDAIATGDSHELIESALEESTQNSKLLLVIQNPDSGSTVSERLGREAAQRIISVWINTNKVKTADEVKWMHAFLAGGTAEVIKKWSASPTKENTDEIFSFIEKATCCVMDIMFDT